VRSLVLESSPALRASGFAFATWKNAFRALDALGVGDKIRKQHLQVQTYVQFPVSDSLVILLIPGDWQFPFCEMLARA
jgi:2-polyprenyl-6-methoxyphenol hydroxylase-like FAD-dependent oxidoreductase